MGGKRTLARVGLLYTLAEWLDENPAHARTIVQEIIDAAAAREAARKAREASRKSVMGIASLPGRLALKVLVELCARADVATRFKAQEPFRLMNV